ncbi:ATP-grasp domain-containing protein [Priestia megaterium]|uniref:ATP-grasp domain-containing protein n=1 Tax=Priestia megaterium TaxID=1404 RepID=UPI0039FD5434
MKKILIIGAGFLQSFVIKKAREMGYYTIAIDKNPESIGFKYAHTHKAIDIVNIEECLRYAREMKIDGVMTAATDYGVLSTAYIAQEMDLPGLDYKSAKVVKNKYMVRRMLFKNKVDDLSQYYEISNLNELKKINSTMQFPVMIKPCDGSGSKGVQRVDSILDLEEASNNAIKASLTGKVLIEDFIEGKEYGVESLVYDGEIYVLGIIKKSMTSPPDYAELGHSMPAKLEIEKRIKEIVKTAISVLGINFGAVNMDILITKDNRISIIDIGARMGGNLIGSHIIPKSTGIDYIGSLIKACIGDLVKLEKYSTYSTEMKIATRLLALKPGKVNKLPDFDAIKDEYNVDIYHHLTVGSTIREYHNNLDGCGYIVSTGKNVKEAEKHAEEVRKLIDESIVRE